MKSFTSLDLQQRTGDIQRAVISEPVVITNHGQPRLIISTVEELHPPQAGKRRACSC